MPVDLKLPHGAFRLIENDVEKDYDGGRVVIQADNGDAAKTSDNPKGNKLAKDKIQGITIIINYMEDEAMKDWPAIREDIAKRRFNVHIWEQEMEEPPTVPQVKA